MKKANLRAQVRQLCCLGLPAETLMPRLLPLLRQIVPAESAGFFWVDGSGAMQNLFAERMLSPQKAQLYFDEFYEGGAFDFRKNFLARAQSGKDISNRPVDNVLKRSDYYNEILRDLDAHHVMHGIVRENGAALGQLSLYRPPDARSFDAKAEKDLQSVLHYLAHAVAARPVADIEHMQMLDTADDAMVLISVNGAILHASDAAKRLLVQSVDGNLVAGQLAIVNSYVTEILRALADTINDDETLPAITRDSRWGRITLRAYRLDESTHNYAPIAVRITRQEPMLLRFAHAMQSIDLSPQLQEIAIHLARGKSNAEIADTLGLAHNTVSYHVKALFNRLGTHGRNESVQHILNAPGVR